MATLYARVPDELHAELAARAEASSTSIATVTRDLLGRALTAEQVRLRAYSTDHLVCSLTLAQLALIVRYGGYQGERSILHLAAPPGKHAPFDITVETGGSRG